MRRRRLALSVLATIAVAATILAHAVRVRRDAAANQKIRGDDWCKIAHYLNGKLIASSR